MTPCRASNGVILFGQLAVHMIRAPWNGNGRRVSRCTPRLVKMSGLGQRIVVDSSTGKEDHQKVQFVAVAVADYRF